MAPHDASAITKFLAQHPSIIHFGMCICLPNIDDPFDPEQTFLPNLRHYEGPRLLLRNLATRTLRAARLGPDIGLAASDVQALKALINPALPFVLSVKWTVAFDDAIQTVLSLLSTEMRHIPHLELQTYKASEFSMENLDHITARLPAFTHIAYFAFTSSKYQLESLVDNPGFEPTFRAWAAASPTLKGCCIGTMAWKKVGEKWEQCTKEQFDILAGFSTFYLT
ncbi:hypothetical protein FB45DRAFT_278575 [Roridomyces roridus]|uniref:Uncharacterized protein n=1 Tax=Roridomyces roridus TaxID=1738132 RepID=A0AAD7CA52_9AGAR|nr:hypothetical protein FB45DRAFT_278575 [Roridomyces roridus]